MIRINYQNNKTGTAVDVTTLICAAKWTTKRSGAPGSMEFTALPDANVTWEIGGAIAVLDDNAGLFYGYIVKISRDEGEQAKITAYDQIWYLKKNKETYVFRGQQAGDIIRQIAGDFGLRCGSLTSTGYAIPSLVEDGKTLIDIILDAIDQTLSGSGRMYVLWDNYGKLELIEPVRQKLDLVIGDNSLATGYTYEESLDGDTANRIKLVQDNATTGGRDVYINQDSNTMRLWGVLQEYKKVDNNMNAAQIKEMGANMLTLYDRPGRTFTVKGISDLEIRAGRGVCVNIAALGDPAYLLVEEASHDLLKGTMTLKLKVV